jgi:phosphoribosyl 1,2-cyclic phosphate phosphodiesterase
MKLTLLGTGDAIGTPKIGCSCPQCVHAKNTGIQRLRTSLLIEICGKHILVDSSPDLRQQLLSTGSPKIDAVIWTHGHYDHFMGFGEFYRVQKMPAVYAARPVLDYCGDIFKFLSFEKHTVNPYEKFDLFGLDITLVEMNHPPVYTCGLVIESKGGKIGFTSDTRDMIPAHSTSLLSGSDLLLVDALVPPEFHISKHMNYREATEFAGRLGVGDYRCVHLSHHVPWEWPHLGRDGECFCFAN